jgi:subtilisin family serine protease
MTTRFLRRGGPRRHEVLLGVVSVAAVVAGIALMGSADATTAGGDIRAADSPAAIRGSYLVMLKDHTMSRSAVAGAAQGMVSRHGGSVQQTWATAVRGFELRGGERTARQIARDPAVAYVEQNQVVRALATQKHPPSFGLDRVDQRRLPVDGSFTAPSTAANVQAWIIDTGIRVTHRDFGGRARFMLNAVQDGVDTDCNGHGTHVAGTVGGSAFGLAKAVQLFAVKVLDCTGSGDTASVVTGVNFVTQHAKPPAVANMSIGGPASAAIDAAVDGSIAAGIVYSIAAGNENQDACNDSPARVPAAITVAASDQRDARAGFSNVGGCVDVFAPGVGITSDFATSDNATRVLAGTSMSTPHVTGAAAIILGRHPGLTPQQVRDRLVTDATPNVIADAGGSPNRLLFVAQN